MIKLRLKEIMDARGIKQIELAEKTNLRPALINEMYKNSRTTVSFDRLEVVMRALNIEDFNDILVLKEPAITEIEKRTTTKKKED